LLDLIKQKPPIRRDPEGSYGCEFSRASFRGIYEQLVFAVDPVTAEYAGLFLSGQTFSKEISRSDSLNRVVDFDIEKFFHSPADALTPRNRVEIGAGIKTLRTKPFASAR
jgi:hypothetical protein